ncbi:putative hypothetical protein [Clostridium botulinum BKT015925]|nr:putative hypothetical protein [Clostridium botulinum BKT015925]
MILAILFTIIENLYQNSIFYKILLKLILHDNYYYFNTIFSQCIRFFIHLSTFFLYCRMFVLHK